MMALIALGGAACGGTADRAIDATEARHGTITGTLRMIGGPAPGRRLLRHTGIDVYSGGTVVGGTATDARGRFRLVLTPGRYRFTLRNGSELFPRHVDVTTNERGHIHLTLSVK